MRVGAGAPEATKQRVKTIGVVSGVTALPLRHNVFRRNRWYRMRYGSSDSGPTRTDGTRQTVQVRESFQWWVQTAA